MNKFSVNTSITDFSLLFHDLEPLFDGLKEAGADGLEIVVGVKSRWSTKKLLHLVNKYDLPITSLHQPMWSGVGLWLDEGFLQLATNLGVKKVVIHPNMLVSIQSDAGQKYLETLAKWQEKYKIQLLLENIQASWKNKFIQQIVKKSLDASSLETIFKMAKKYGFLINFDTSHASLIKPHENEVFRKIFPYIENIHLSSFSKSTDHLPLYMGNFDTQGFIKYLYQKKYKGLITFEIFFPGDIQVVKYNFEAIKKSVKIIKSI